MNRDNKYYAVTCKCGHTDSRRTYIPITFPVIAENGRKAAEIARYIPRCKHHHKDCILDVKEITYEKFNEINIKNSNDPYLQCTSIQEQRTYDIEYRFVADPHFIEEEDKREYTNKSIFNGKTKIRKPKRFIRNYELEGAFAY